MITIQRTVDIPADRRLSLDFTVPETIPAGKARVTVLLDNAATQDTDPLARLLSQPSPTIEEIKAEAARKTKERLADPSRDSLNRYAGCLADSPAFEGDAVAIQRKMRDEWN
jgi:hypothetical protein